MPNKLSSASLAASAAQTVDAATAEVRYDYKQAIRKRALMLIIGAAIGVLLVLIDMLTGSAPISIRDVFCVLSGMCQAPELANTIVRVYRLPATLMALSVGASLGIAGAIMQTILRNPLASPYTLGISAGAGFGAALTIVTGFATIQGLGIWLIPFNAFVFAMLSSLLIYLIGSSKNLTPATMILTGIGLSFMFSALQSALQYAATVEQNQNIVFWLFGSLSKAETKTALSMLLMVLVLLPILMSQAWKFTALQLGDEKATGLGINVKRLRLFGFVLASLLTSLAVSFVGTIGFVGLAGPHIARMLVGEDQRFFIPFSSLCGALVLLLANVLSKVIIEEFIFPIGIVTSLIGVPIFFSVIVSKKRSYFS